LERDKPRLANPATPRNEPAGQRCECHQNERNDTNDDDADDATGTTQKVLQRRDFSKQTTDAIRGSAKQESNPAAQRHKT
jgi:hypothetical protein